MTKAVVLFHTGYGHTARVAEFVAKGANAQIIAIDANGVPYGNHRTRDMPHAYFSGASEIVAKMRVEK